MRVTSLPSPGNYSNSQDLRTDAAKAISHVEIVAAKTAGGKTTSATTLRAFFSACATALDSIYDSTAPTVSTRVATDTDEVTVTFTEALDAGVVPGIADFAFTPTREVTDVAVVGSTVVVTATGAIATDTIAYVKPTVNALRDPAGNQVASFSGVVA